MDLVTIRQVVFYLVSTKACQVRGSCNNREWPHRRSRYEHAGVIKLLSVKTLHPSHLHVIVAIRLTRRFTALLCLVSKASANAKSKCYDTDQRNRGDCDCVRAEVVVRVFSFDLSAILISTARLGLPSGSLIARLRSRCRCGYWRSRRDRWE